MTIPEDKTPSPGQSAHNSKDDKAAAKDNVAPKDDGTIPPDGGSDPITVVGGSLTIHSPYRFEYRYDEGKKMHIYELKGDGKTVKDLTVKDGGGTMKFQDKPASGKFKIDLDYS